VNWHTNDSDLNVDRTYRIQVWVGGVELGYADVDVVADQKQLKKVDTSEFVPLKSGRTLPIRFRIEEGALFYAATDGEETCDDCGVGVIGPEGGEISSRLGLANLIVPEGVLEKDQLLTLERVNDPPPPSSFGGDTYLLGTGPFPTAVPQYGPFYRVTSPETIVFDDPEEGPILVVCQAHLEGTALDPPGPEDHHYDLVVAARKPDQEYGIIELPSADVPAGLCSGAPPGPAPGESSFGSLALHWIGGLIGPAPLHAAPMLFSHTGAAARLAGMGECDKDKRPPPGTVGVGLCGGEYVIVDPTALGGTHGDLLFLSTFDVGPPLAIETPEVGRWQNPTTTPGTVSIVETEIGDLGGPGNPIMKLETPPGLPLSWLTRIVGSFAMEADAAYSGFIFTAGEYSMTWESVVGEGSSGGAIAAANSQGDVIAMLEYEPGGELFFGGRDFGIPLEYPKWKWQSGKSQRFEIRVNLDDYTASLFINGKLAAEGTLAPDVDPEVFPQTYLGRVVVALEETGEALTFGVDDLKVRRTAGSGLEHSSISVTPDPVYVTPEEGIPTGAQIALIDVVARYPDGSPIVGEQVDLVVKTVNNTVFPADWMEIIPPPLTDANGETQGKIIARYPLELTVDALIPDTWDDPYDYLTFVTAPPEMGLDHIPTWTVTPTLLDPPWVSGNWSDPQPDATYTVEITMVDASGAPLEGLSVEHHVHLFSPVAGQGCLWDEPGVGWGTSEGLTDALGQTRAIVGSSQGSGMFAGPCYRISSPDLEWPWFPDPVHLDFREVGLIFDGYVYGTATFAESGTPIANKDIKVEYAGGYPTSPPPNADPPEWTMTTVDGHYLWDPEGNQVEGDYLFTLDPGPGGLNYQQLYHLPGDVLRNRLDFVVPPYGSISGTVTVDGAGYAGLTVSLIRNGPLATTTTDAGGNYTFSNIQPQDYWVSVDGLGSYWNQVAEVGEGEAVTLDFTGMHLSPVPSTSLPTDVTSWAIDLPSETTYVCNADPCNSGPPSVATYATAEIPSGSPDADVPPFSEGVDFYYFNDDLGFYVRLGEYGPLSDTDNGVTRFYSYGFTLVGKGLPLGTLQLVAVGENSGTLYNTPINSWVIVTEPLMEEQY
jgi:hypothetical protein